MVKKIIIPERGDIVWIDFSPIKGHEQSGLRPAVIVSSSKYNVLSGIVLACPVTSKQKSYFFEVAIQGLNKKSFVLADQVRAFDYSKRIKKVAGKVSELEIREILAKISLMFQ